MIYLRRKRPRVTSGAVYSRARHRVVDSTYAAALAEAGDTCRAEDAVPVSATSPRAARSDGVKTNVQIVTLHGELDVSKKEFIEEELGRIERFAPPTVAILDLSDVRYLDTTFLNALLRTQQRIRKQSGRCVRIVAPPAGFISRVFAVTNLAKRFEMFDTILSAQRNGSRSVDASKTAPTS